MTMKTFDFYAAIYDNDVYCIECLPSGVNAESEDVLPIFADSEWYYIPICIHCGHVHDYINLLEEDE